jgi:hypothetical protein
MPVDEQLGLQLFLDVQEVVDYLQGLQLQPTAAAAA